MGNFYGWKNIRKLIGGSFPVLERQSPHPTINPYLTRIMRIL
jgi:hypothetical protein